MLHNIMRTVDRIVKFDSVDAHCDIPCKIYDPSAAQIAALSVVRMIDILNELDGSNQDLAYLNTVSRVVAEKEISARKVKDEVRIIWGDYIKAPQLEKYPELHDLAHSIMLLASKTKVTVDREAAVELVGKVNRFAEIFWATKDVKTKTAKCPYPPALDTVYPDL
jgi:nickel superoxide dismutase